jgi:predicted outer membrane protein
MGSQEQVMTMSAKTNSHFESSPSNLKNAIVSGGLLLALSAVALAVELTPEDLEAGAQRKRREVAEAQEAVDSLETARREAAKKQKPSEVKRISAELKQAKQALESRSSQSVETYAEMILADRKKSLDDQARVEEERKAAAQKAEAELAALQETAKKEADRHRESGGCPLQIVGANFFHVDAETARLGARTGHLPADLFGASTIVVCQLVNRASEPVEAHEILIQFVDGFDEVIREHTLKGTLLAPGQESKSVNGFPQVETAVTLKIFVQRTKLPDGTVWQRLPEHKQTGVVLKKPEGADVIGRK